MTNAIYQSVKPIISVSDPAIDETKSDLKQYAITRDIEHLNFLPDTKPTIFHVRKISARESSRFQKIMIDFHKTIDPVDWFMYCVCKIENLTDPEGNFHPEIKPSLQVANTELAIWSNDAELEDKLGLCPAVIIEVGEFAAFQSFLAKGEQPNYMELPRLIRYQQLVKKER